MRALLPLCAMALAFALTPLVSSARPAAEELSPLIGDALVAPPRAAALSAAGDMRGPSQYLAGKVAVRLVLPESDGGAEPSTESWTPAEIAHVTAQVQSALDWWAARLPLARLRFALRVDVAPTAYEPVAHGLAEEGLWIGDALARLGYTGPSYFDQLYAAGDAHRAATGSDWTTTIFVVDSSAHPTGHLADGRFAYAYINGPHMVVTSDAGPYGAARLAPVIAHELGHTFGALDQYAAARVACERRSGYLNAPTSNSQYGGCGGREPSIMLEPLGAFVAGQVDPSARAQVGYQDSDGDGVIDPLDTAPSIDLAEERLAAGSGRPLLSGGSRDLPFPAPHQQQVTLNTIAAVEYRVDGGPWLPVPAADGAYDEAAEAFAFELPVYDGVYTVEARAVNSAGVVSAPARRQVAVSWLGPAPAYSPAAPAAVNSLSLPVRLGAPASTRAVQLSERPDFGGAEWQPYAAELPFPLAPGDGARTIFVRFSDAAGLASLPFALPVLLDTVAPAGWAARDPASPTGLILRAHDATSGVAAVEVRLGDGAPAWRPFAPAIEPGPAGAGRPVTLRLRDGA
ncbi:MAG TPA: hypothetical protein PKD53_08190, partial [Chloroflexaceae bacterium]|nr:hypothetical protein [Chloroflexaceae bacterium]